LFSQISLNWAGQPLRTFETLLGYIRGTTTRTGLKVTARLLAGVYQVGKRVADAVMKSLKIEHHAVCPRWNYTIRPRLASTGSTLNPPPSLGGGRICGPLSFHRPI
jgi:Rhodopirellula transposase DDE domain